ncbi:hypothetical protein BKM31_40305 [[Actinomadura] parvosata subsp. kistnae]|uniref:DUF7711 domain-containing protein n=2 Tax=Nonomuraea TaxID=83681 RepID=A0A1V0A9J3_9ACTN|nr:hypothetical protein BKM31_40305 [Nonomuraea sp. ATCC 55076]
MVQLGQGADGGGGWGGLGWAGEAVEMRYGRAVERLRMLAEACEQTRRLPAEEPFLREAYVFGGLVEGADPVDEIEVAFVLNLPPEEVAWGTHPPGTAWLVDFLRLDQGGVAYWWRSFREPVANHRIHEPVRFWSLDGVDEGVLEALRGRRFGELRGGDGEARAEERVAGVAEELEAALEHLRAVHGAYWDRRWRREHRGLRRYPEHHLWEAVRGYLELLDLPRDE